MVKAAFIGTLAAIVLAACSPFGGASVFNCEQDSQCSPSGSCKLPEGLCTFPNASCPSGQEYGQHSGSMSGKCVGDDVGVDAAIDAPTMCTPSAKTCFNHAIETCKATGDGFEPAMKEQCALTCAEGSTTCSTAVASNIPVADQKACHATGSALALSPTSGATVTIAQTEITCTPMCNAGGTTTIPRTASTPNNFFCLAALNIPTGVTVNVTATSATTLFSHGAAAINSNISFDAGDAAGAINGAGMTADDVPGRGGPGGFIGGALSNNDSAGLAGMGPCAGGVGGNVGTGMNAAGAGGGGGGHVGTGGAGGNGQNPNGAGATGGTAGVNTACSSNEARPLVGGSGGSGGGDGSCGVGVRCGWPGGGGGGALHVVSRSTISGSGTVSANGGDGFGEATQAGGGGGGGAGGTLLLEAPAVTFTGPLQVTGGTGGISNPGNNAGTGAAAGNLNGGPGGAAQEDDRGGAGGGGGGGRIRINATAAACPASVTPTASCSTGALRTTP
ncbi:MAG: hypothetical protein M4D80_29175 [Myxococcota bacterium]|nr:hypothetical protein [Myxococcota bacterium]